MSPRDALRQRSRGTFQAPHQFCEGVLCVAVNGQIVIEQGQDTGARAGRALGVIGIPGDRPDHDQREYGALAATAFDRLYVREDHNLRGRKPGESAANVLAGVETARKHGRARTEQADAVLGEIEASRVALREAQPGDLVVICADDAAAVYGEAMALNRAPRRGTAIVAPGEMAVPEG